MGLRIFVSDIELPIVKETLRIKEENSVFTSDFSVARSANPFLVIDNETARKALGVVNLYSRNTKITHNAFVFDNGEKFSAEVTILENISGAIKCNLTYSSDALTEFPNLISSYFESISVKGGDIEEQIEEYIGNYDDSSYKGFVENYVSRSYPSVDFNFPTLKYPTRQGELDEDDDWHKFNGEINNKSAGVVSLNSNINNVLINQNIIVPYYYLLAPLYKVFVQYLGYNLSGSFVENKAIQNTLMHHEEDNLVAINVDLVDTTAILYKQLTTIHPERFLPDWTVAEYLNNLQNNYNLKIDISNETKEIKLNFAQEVFFSSPILDISNYIMEREFYPKYLNYTNYVIYSADESDLINVSLDNVSTIEPDNDTTVELYTQFKEVPETLTEDWEDQSGVGLLFYDFKKNSVYNIPSFNEVTNRIDGDNGIANTYWVNWFKMRLKEKEFSLNLKCSPKQKHDLESAVKVYLFNQEFIIKEYETEQLDKHYLIKVTLLSFNP